MPEGRFIASQIRNSVACSLFGGVSSSAPGIQRPLLTFSPSSPLTHPRGPFSPLCSTLPRNVPLRECLNLSRLMQIARESDSISKTWPELAFPPSKGSPNAGPTFERQAGLGLASGQFLLCAMHLCGFVCPSVSFEPRGRTATTPWVEGPEPCLGLEYTILSLGDPEQQYQQTGDRARY